MREKLHSFDRVISTHVTRLPDYVRLVMEFFTLIGQPPFTVGIAAAVLGYGTALGKEPYVVSGWIAIGTIVISSIMKLMLRRVRPRNEYVRHMLFKTYSFPSGHAAGSLVSYGLAAFIIGIKWPELAIVAWTAAIIVSFMIGLSRVYLGAHYASDVIGGWIVGAIGLALILVSGT